MGLHARNESTEMGSFGGIKRLYADKTSYNGKINQDGLPHGQGLISYCSQTSVNSKETRSSYKGLFENGQRHGTGELTEVTSSYTYVGDFEDDLPHGYGHIEWADTSQFTGKMSKGRMQTGAYTFVSGNHYEGSFSEHTGTFEG